MPNSIAYRVKLCTLTVEHIPRVYHFFIEEDHLYVYHLRQYYF